jgi:hypothetical protein
MTSLTITDPSGAALANPIIVNAKWVWFCFRP